MDACTEATLCATDETRDLGLSGVLPWRDCPYPTGTATPMMHRNKLKIGIPCESIKDSAMGDEPTWMSWLHAATRSESPFADRQTSKLSPVHADTECVLHHRAAEYANQRNYNQDDDDDNRVFHSLCVRTTVRNTGLGSRLVPETIRQSRSRKLHSPTVCDSVIMGGSEPVSEYPGLPGSNNDRECDQLVQYQHHQYNYHHPHRHHHTDDGGEVIDFLSTNQPNEPPDSHLLGYSPAERTMEITEHDRHQCGPVVSSEVPVDKHCWIGVGRVGSQFDSNRKSKSSDTWYNLRCRVMEWLSNVTDVAIPEQDLTDKTSNGMC